MHQEQQNGQCHRAWLAAILDYEIPIKEYVVCVKFVRIYYAESIYLGVYVVNLWQLEAKL